LKRGLLYLLSAEGKVKSVSLRRKGNQKGCRLFCLQSVSEYLHRLMADQGEQILKDPAIDTPASAGSGVRQLCTLNSERLEQTPLAPEGRSLATPQAPLLRPLNKQHHSQASECSFINEKQLLARLSISRRTLFNWRATGKIPSVRLGGRRVLFH
jgi:predicted DNA-binding transcriptional regulator AlpA